MPVRFADVDHAGIVYYPVFFHYFHIAFEEFFRAHLGAQGYVQLLDQQRIGFPAVRAECDYRQPLRFGEDVEVELGVVALGERSVTFQYRAFRCDAPERGPLAALGKVVCAVVDLEKFRAVRIPPELLQLFSATRASGEPGR
jgi:4-hydroxybenzoyl-CoA thioesterase